MYLRALISSMMWAASSEGSKRKKTPLKLKPSLHLGLFVFGSLQVKIVERAGCVCCEMLGFCEAEVTPWRVVFDFV